MSRQRRIREWSERNSPRTTGIHISRMAYATLKIDPPLLEAESVAGEIDQRVFRSTEYAIRRAAPNAPDRPEEATAYCDIVDGARERSASRSTQQTQLTEALR